MNALDYIRVVLVEPTHPGNIGATARAMANMGLSHLYLVQPRDYPSEIATARAASGAQVLERCQVVETVDQAIAECSTVFGATARTRSIRWPSLEPAPAMARAIHKTTSGPVALLFGRESRGLTNHELDRCHHLVQIPVDEAAPSLNLAAAVMVLCYELRRSSLGDQPVAPEASDEPMATASQMQHFYAHLERVLTLIEFTDGRSSKLQRKLIRLFNRARPYKQEIDMLRGILTAVEIAVRGRD